MDKLIFFVLTGILCFFIFYKKGHEKLPWFFAGLLFFPHSSVLVETPAAMSIPRIVTYAIIIAILNENNWKFEFSRFPLKNALFIVAILYLMIGLFDKNISLFHKFYRPFLIYIQEFFIILIPFICIKKKEHIIYLYKVLLWFFLIFCVYGIANYITKTNQYANVISETFHAENYVNTYTEALVERFRISSFTWHPIYYGYLLSVAILISIFLILNYKSTFSFTLFNSIVLFLMLINLVLANSRTPIVALLCALIIVLLFGSKPSHQFKAVSGVTVLVFLIFTIKPDVVNLATETYNTFTSGGSKLEGSSIEMRTRQFNASVSVFNKSPITGNGFYYISEGLGFAIDEDANFADKDFAGFESYVYKLLIEQGLCGMIANFVLFSGMALFFYKRSGKKTFSGKIALLSNAMLLAFLLFIFGTGDMNSFPIFMAIMGVNIKGAMLKDTYPETSDDQFNKG